MLKWGRETITTKTNLLAYLTSILFLWTNHCLLLYIKVLPRQAQSFIRYGTIEEAEVLIQVSILDINKATGHDKISAGLVKTVASAISGSPMILFNERLLSDQFLSEWKFANVM